jgi:hypothetical protein
MRKIHPGFKALAILLGPACLIIAHQKITEYAGQGIANPSDPAALIRQAYASCSEAPRLQQASGCDEFVGYLEQCAALKERCDPRSVYKVLVRLNLSPELPEMPTINKVAVTEGE